MMTQELGIDDALPSIIPATSRKDPIAHPPTSPRLSPSSFLKSPSRLLVRYECHRRMSELESRSHANLRRSGASLDLDLTMSQ
jgi:hypothetical protein